MARYFFDIDNGLEVRDTTGQEFPDEEAAQTEAFRRAAEYSGNLSNLRDSGVIVVSVRDAPETTILKSASYVRSKICVPPIDGCHGSGRNLKR